jgi:hypothetical protein
MATKRNPNRATACEKQYTNEPRQQTEIEATYSISLKDDKLVLRRKNVNGETPLVGQFADALSAAGTGGIRFTRDNQNRVNGFLLTTGRVRNLRFVRS